MREFKPGDLALTVYPIPSVPAGTVVLLEQKLSPGDDFVGPKGIQYTALAHGWICSRAGYSAISAYAESSLMPLRGDMTSERQKSEGLIHE